LIAKNRACLEALRSELLKEADVPDSGFKIEKYLTSGVIDATKVVNAIENFCYKR
jgi:hypothetical protein